VTAGEPLAKQPARPPDLALAAWIIIVYPALRLLFVLGALAMPESAGALAEENLPAGLVLGVSVLTSLLPIACGLAILAGRGWGRIVYTIGWPALTAYSWFAVSFEWMQLLSVAIYALVVYVLFQRSATAYLREAAEWRAGRSSHPGRGEDHT